MVRSALAILLAFAASPLNAQADCNDDAMLVFDASGSMAAVGYNGLDIPRIVEARDALKRVLPDVTPFREMGLVVYGPGTNDSCSNIALHFGPQQNAGAAIFGVIDQTEPDGDTPLTEAVRRAADVVGSGQRSADIVLITDGRETCDGAPCRLAADLAGTDLTVHVIGFRVRGTSFEWRSNDNYDVRNHQTVARCLADRTGGEYVPAESTDDLVDALREILSCPIIG